MTNSMKVYATIVKLQDILQSLEGAVDKQYWPDSLKKARALINNAEQSEAQAVAKQALNKSIREAA